MRLKKSFKIALNIILNSKLRSWLTIIGIVIGIAAIVSIVSLSQGAQRTLEQNLNSLSVDIITINPGFSRAMGMGAEFRGGGGPEGGGFGGGGFTQSSASVSKNLTVRDLTVLKSISNIKEIMGTISGSVDEVSYLGKTARGSIQGVDPAVWKNIISTELSSGRYLNQGDVNVVVIGGRIASSTFTDVQINRQISIDGKAFNIVGILKESGGNDDSRIFMPISSAINVLEDKDAKTFDSITVKVKDISLTDNTILQITTKLMASHGILQGKRQDFSVSSLKSMQERVSSTLSSMTLFLTAIAAISLIVGAIGIMNSTFTSVLEKTRDIGILKALGARNMDIMIIFLLNSGLVGLIGGILGVVLGLFGSSFIGQLAGASFGRLSLSSAYTSIPLMIEVFALSMFVGLVAGAVPAYGASKLKPVDALRYE